MMIVSIALIALLITVSYARDKANENYHYRSALLAAIGKMEYVKFVNRDVKSPDISSLPAAFFSPVVLDDRGDKPDLTASVSINKTFHTDIEVAPYVGYDMVILELTWQEPNSFVIIPQSNQTRTVTLREDYHRMLTQ